MSVEEDKKSFIDEIESMMKPYEKLVKESVVMSEEIVLEKYVEDIADIVKTLMVIKDAKEVDSEAKKSITDTVNHLKRILKSNDDCKCKDGKCTCNKKVTEASMKGKYTGRMIVTTKHPEGVFVGDIIKHINDKALYAIHEPDENGKAGKKVGEHLAGFIRKYLKTSKSNLVGEEVED